MIEKYPREKFYLKALLFISILLLGSVVVWKEAEAASLPSSPKIIEKACNKYNMDDCDLVTAIAWVENRYKNKTVMDVGSLSYGMMQVKCGTARMMGLKYSCKQLNTPIINLRFAILYIKYQLKRYGGDYPRAIAAYNAGTAKTCDNYNGNQCYPGEFVNQGYVFKVWRKYRWLKKEKQETLVLSFSPSKQKDGSEKQTMPFKLAYPTSLEFAKGVSTE